MYLSRILICKAMQEFDEDSIWFQIAQDADAAWRNENAKDLLRLAREALDEHPCIGWHKQLLYVISHELESEAAKCVSR